MGGGPDLRLVSQSALAAYMSYRGLSVRELATRTGVNRSTIGHLRSGKRSGCVPHAAKRISKALDVPCEALFVDLNAQRAARKNAKHEAA